MHRINGGRGMVEDTEREFDKEVKFFMGLHMDLAFI